MAKRKPVFDKAAAKDRVLKIFPILKKTYPGAKTELVHADPFQLLVATILSAQCTDDRVNHGDAGTFQEVSGPEEFCTSRAK